MIFYFKNILIDTSNYQMIFIYDMNNNKCLCETLINE